MFLRSLVRRCIWSLRRGRGNSTSEYVLGPLEQTVFAQAIAATIHGGDGVAELRERKEGSRARRRLGIAILHLERSQTILLICFRSSRILTVEYASAPTPSCTLRGPIHVVRPCPEHLGLIRAVHSMLPRRTVSPRAMSVRRRTQPEPHLCQHRRKLVYIRKRPIRC